MFISHAMNVEFWIRTVRFALQMKKMEYLIAVIAIRICALPVECKNANEQAPMRAALIVSLSLPPCLGRKPIRKSTKEMNSCREQANNSGTKTIS
jgi:hypothetical protein